MHVLLEVTKTTFDVANFIVISMDEIIAIDNTMIMNPFEHGAKVKKDSNPPLWGSGMFAIFSKKNSFDAKMHNWFWGLRVGGVGKKVGYHGL